MHIIFKLLKKKIKKTNPKRKLWKKEEEEKKKNKTLYLKKNKVKNYSGLCVRNRKEEESGVKYFKYWKKKISPQPKILYAVKLFFRSEGKLDTFSDRQKPREFTSPEDLSFKKNQEG